MSKLTPLHDLHQKLSAKLVDFAGYKLPIQYPMGIIKEALYTRETACLFDIGHMGQVNICQSAVDQLQKLIPADLAALDNYQHCYSFLLNENGGIIDDLIIAKRDDHFYMVINGACKDKDIAHISKHIPSDKFTVIDDKYSLIAVQGPKARDILSTFNSELSQLTFLNGGWFELNNIPCYVSCSGYTGEDGYEISVPVDQAEQLAEAILATDVEPAGLGSRDALRLEAGLCLYGNDLNEDITPIQAGLIWAIPKSRRHIGDNAYLGAHVVNKEINDRPSIKRVGLIADSKIPLRPHMAILDENGTEVGEIKSAAVSPHIGKPIGMGYIDHSLTNENSTFHVEVRNKKIDVALTKVPFIKQKYVHN